MLPSGGCEGCSGSAGRKSCAITTAKRLGQFLGDDRIKDKGLNCNYVVAKRPENLPTSERAIPLAIFSTSPAVARSFLRKWCGDLGGGAPPLLFHVLQAQVCYCAPPPPPTSDVTKGFYWQIIVLAGCYNKEESIAPCTIMVCTAPS
jgi:hypothetical protein